MSDANQDPVLAIPEGYRDDKELAQLQDSADVAKLRDLLSEGEVVLNLVLCTVDDREAVLAATNYRIIFCDKLLLGADVLSFKYREIAAVLYYPEMITHKLNLVHVEGSLAVTGVDLEHGKRFINFIQDKIGQDYMPVGDAGRAFEHRGEMIKLEELPSQN